MFDETAVFADADDIEQLTEKIMDGEMTVSLANISEPSAEILVSRIKKIISTMVDFKELIMMYTCAMKEIQTKFDVLDTEYKVKYQRNPITSINARLKRTSSIVEKLMRLGYPVNIESIEKNIHDVAGVRVVCAYVDDIYRIAEAFLKQDDIKLISRKDYIAEPKPNGYRSLHLIVQIPVFFEDICKNMTVEVQIRTIAQDFWASLEHQLKYKKEIQNSEEIISQLKTCAEVINATDMKMLDIRRQIESDSPSPSDEEVLIEKLKRIDTPIE